MSISRSKKILIVSHNSFSLHANNGKTLSSIFGDWDKNNIAQIFFQDEVPETHRFKFFYRIRDVDIIKRILSFGFVGRCGDVVFPGIKVSSSYNGSNSLVSYFLNFARTLNGIKVLIRDMIYMTNLWKTSGFKSWVDSFAPEGIFLVGGNYLLSFRVACYLSRRYKIPLYIYITDDYILTPKPAGVFDRYMHKRLNYCYRKYLAISKNVFVIGREMADEFGAHFSREFIPVMNSVSIPSSFPERHKSGPLPDCLDIVYIGGLHLGRDKSIIQFSDIIKRVSDIIGFKINLTVYSIFPPAESALKLFIANKITYGGSLNQMEVGLRVASADFALHVESFESKFRELTRLSVSTKIPEYLVSGSCLLAFGPPELASIKIVSENKIGVVYSELDNEICFNENLKYFQSAIERRALSVKGFNYAKKEFDIDVIRRKIDFYLNCEDLNV